MTNKLVNGKIIELTAEEETARDAEEAQAVIDKEARDAAIVPEYVKLRLTEYPNHNDCIHALLDGGDTLTDLQAKRQEVKDKYPK